MAKKQTRGAPGRKRLMPAGETTKLLVTIPADLDARVRRVADRLGITLSQWWTLAGGLAVMEAEHDAEAALKVSASAGRVKLPKERT